MISGARGAVTAVGEDRQLLGEAAVAAAPAAAVVADVVDVVDIGFAAVRNHEAGTGNLDLLVAAAAVEKAYSTDPAGAAAQAADGDYHWQRTPFCSKDRPKVFIMVLDGILARTRDSQEHKYGKVDQRTTGFR